PDPLYAVRRASWGDPMVFRPERWLAGRRHGRWDYMPYGAGPRACIGQHLAMAELQLIAVAFSSAFDMVPLAGPLADHRPVAGVTLSPPAGSLRVGVRVRHAHAAAA
ncbi:cytochrome P450, partial [Azospirillum sp. B4]|uniref:cytochrome P450 n=1 Tax=Azospirillum sp. B4 TaxID=95605 RepID=UPI0011DE5701